MTDHVEVAMVETKLQTALILVAALLVAGLSTAGSVEGDLGEPPYYFTLETVNTAGQAEIVRSVTVDGWNRSAVVALYYNDYAPPLTVPMQWTGNVATCTAGTTSQAYLNATFQTINYYRSMAGLAVATNAASYNANAQQAALMMSANNALSHSPPSTWTCWTAGGAAAASSSNLALGNAGPSAVVAYIRDSGSGNSFVGHRRWILYPLLNRFGTGSVGETTVSANALTVFTGFDPRPPSPDKVAWPPEGYVPYQVVYPRWSLALNTGSTVSFASASVTMTEGANPIPVSVVSRTDNGYGDNTIVWEPSGFGFTPGSDDRRLTVTVSNILVGGSPSTEVYDVVVIDPAVVTDLIFGNGFESGTTGSWTVTVP